MIKVLSIGLLLIATNAQASLRSISTDDTANLRPVSLTQQRQVTTPSRPACKPVLILLRFPDGRFMLVGAIAPKTC
jgi:hypothetical protein